MKKQTKTTNHKTKEQTVKKSGKSSKKDENSFWGNFVEEVPEYEMTRSGASEISNKRNSFGSYVEGLEFKVQSGVPICVENIADDDWNHDRSNHSVFVNADEYACDQNGFNRLTLIANEQKIKLDIMFDPMRYHTDRGDVLITMLSMTEFMTGNGKCVDLLTEDWHREALHCNRNVSPLKFDVLSLTHFAEVIGQILNPSDSRHDALLYHCRFLDDINNVPIGTYQEYFRLLVHAEPIIRQTVEGSWNTLLVRREPEIASYFIPENLPIIHYHGFVNHEDDIDRGEFTCVHISDLAAFINEPAEALKWSLLSWDPYDEPYLELARYPKLRDKFYNYLMYRVMVPSGTVNGFIHGVKVVPPAFDYLVHVSEIPALLEKRHGIQFNRSDYLNEVHKLKSQTLLMYLTEETQSTSHEQQPTQGENS